MQFTEIMAIDPAGYQAWLTQHGVTLKANGVASALKVAATVATPKPPDRNALQKVVDSIANLTAALRGQPAASATPQPAKVPDRPARVDPLDRERQRLRDIHAALGPGRDSTALEMAVAGLSAKQAGDVLLSADQRWAWNVDGVRQAYSGKKNFFLAAYAADAADAAKSARRADLETQYAGNRNAAEPANETETDPNKIWDANKNGLQKSYSGNKLYFLAVFRKDAEERKAAERRAIARAGR